MQSGAVIEGFDVVEDGGANFGKGGEALVIDDLVFETAPEGFDEGVVVAVAFAAHGGDQTVLGEELPVSGTGKLVSETPFANDRLEDLKPSPSAHRPWLRRLMQKKRPTTILLFLFFGSLPTRDAVRFIEPRLRGVSHAFA